MKIIVIDSGLGGKDFINKFKSSTNQKNINSKLVIPFDRMVSSYNKDFVRSNLLPALYNDFSYKKL